MQTVIKEYGRAFAAAAAAVAVFALIFTSALGVGDGGVFGAIPKVFATSTQTGNDMEHSDAASFAAAGRKVPVIRSHPICRLGQEYVLSEIFIASDAESFESVRLLELDVIEDGEARAAGEDEVSGSDNGRIVFKKEGLYRARVAVVDGDGIMNSASFYIGVEG